MLTMSNKKQKVLLIGWDAADWKIINRLIDKGEMPALQKLVENGVMGNISTLEPAYSPILWTTIATGKYADKHGILGFIEPTPDHSAFRPVSNSTRKVKALWNMLTQKGYKTHVINWWPSHPAEPVNGIYVSNLYPKTNTFNLRNWRLPDDAIHPRDLKDLFSHIRVHPLEFSNQHIRPFIPEYQFVNRRLDHRIENIARLLAEASSIQAAATMALEHEEWDFAAVYWDTIDHFCHGFMNYSPPMMKGIKEADFKIFNQVVDGAYRLMDLMLARLLELAGNDCNVILISDHGFKSGDLRDKYIPNEPAGPAYHHRNLGIFCAKGPDIRKDEIVYGASLLDITPTILSIFGLPVGEDMDGKPLVEIFNRKLDISSIPSWETEEGECGMLPDEKRDLDPVYSAGAIQQLIDLGYIDEPGPDIKKSVQTIIDELDYNLAQVYYFSHRFHLALPVLEKLFDKYPHRGRYLFKLVNCYLSSGLIQEAEDKVALFKVKAGNKLLKKEQAEAIKNHKIPVILTEKEKKEWVLQNIMVPLKESHQARNDLFQLNITEGDILLQKGYTIKAIQKYRSLDKKKKKGQSYYAQMGNAFLKTGQWRDAEKMFKGLIDFNPEHHSAYLGLGIAYFNLKKYEKALDNFLHSASINFYDFVTHYNIGRTLIQLGDNDNGVNALETTLKINPNFGLARNILIDVCENKLNNYERANKYKIEGNEVAVESNKPVQFQEELIIRPVSEKNNASPVIVVSGLPRSGTSMMMQLLEAAGIPVFADGLRGADDNNPLGYYEHNKVKKLIGNNTWLTEVQGKAIKIVLPLLYKIPASLKYKIIFMLRSLDEIVESQHAMLVTNKKLKENTFNIGVQETFRNYLDYLEPWALKNKNVEILFVNYKQTIEDPFDTIKKISSFLDMVIDEKEVSKFVIKELYRVKSS